MALWCEDLTPRARVLARFVAVLLVVIRGLSSQAVYVPNYSTSNISAYIVNPSNGMLTNVAGSPFSSGTSPIEAVIHPSGKFLYVLDAGSSDVTAYSISAPSGALNMIEFYSAIAPAGMAMDPTGQFLYVTNSPAGTITLYNINGTNGTLIPRAPVPAGAGTSLAHPVVDPGGRYLYVADSGSGTVSGFTINAGGTLTAIPGSPFTAGSGARGVAASASMVFVANRNSGDLTVYRIGPGGTLSQLGFPVSAGGSPLSVAVDPSGNYVYVANQMQVVAFSTTGNDTFPLNQIRAYSAGTRPYAVTVDQDGKFLYVANYDSSDISGFAISAGGTLIPLGSSSTFGAYGPESVTVHHIGDTTSISLATGYPSPVSPGQYGTPVEIKGAVTNTSNPSLVPQGSVTFSVNGSAVPNGTVALDGSGGFDFTFNGSTEYLPAGANVIQAAYNPGAGFEAPAPLQIGYSSRNTVSVSPPGASGTLVYGQPLALTATVSAAPGDGTPTGTVAFKEGTTTLGTGILIDGSASVTIATLATGPHTVTAAYGGDAFFLPRDSAGSAAVTIAQATPTVTVTTTRTATAVYGQQVTITATLTGTAGGSGTVDFEVNGTPAGSSGMGGMMAILAYNPPAVGPYTITASYSGDANNHPGSGSTSMMVNQASVNVSAASVSGNPMVGQAVTFTATVSAASPGSGTPSGSVVFKDGSTELGTASLAAGSASLTSSSLAAGVHTITAAYGGDASFLPGTSAGPVTIAKATPALSVGASQPSPLVSGQSVTVTAVLSGSAGPGFTGTVDFFDEGVKINAAPAAVGGSQAQFGPYAVGGAGTHAITAVYSGDGNYNPVDNNAGPLSMTVNQAAVSVSAAASSGSAVYGQPLTLTAAVSVVAPGSGTPTGTVSFKDGAATLGPGTLAGGSASLTIATLDAGPHTITAAYGGDANFLSGSSAAGAQVTIAQATPTVTVTTTQTATAVYGQPVTLAAALGGTATATGAVDFSVNGTKAGSGTVAGNAAILVYTPSAVASYTITASYSGDANNRPGSGSATLAVNQASVNVSAPAVSGTRTAGQPVTFTAAVSAVSPGSGTPSGGVVFKDGSTALGTVSLAAGSASFTSPSLAVGDHTITAAYAGDANFTAGTSASSSVTIAKATPALSVGANPGSPLVSGQGLTFIATLSGGAGAAFTGTVDFFDGAAKINAAPAAVGGGQAQFGPYMIGGAGTHLVTAVYSGDATYNSANNSATPLSLAVGRASTTASSPAASGAATFGRAVKFTVAVSAVAPGCGTPTGRVAFKDGAVPLGTASLVAGSASLTSSALAAGAHSITASYDGDANFTGAVSPALAFTEGKGDTTTVLSISQGANSTMLTASVSGTSAAVTPTGAVQFFNGTSLLGSAILSSGAGLSATAVLNLGALSGMITAAYTGDANFAPSVSSAALASPVAKSETSLTLSAAPNPAMVGRSITLTANFSWTGSTAPGGTIRFYDGSTLLGSVPASARAVFTTSLPAGTHNVMAAYTGDGIYPASSGGALVVVSKNGASVALGSDLAAVVFGQTVTLTAKVSGQAAGTAAPTGQVEFRDGSALLGSVAVVNGTARLALLGLAPGPHETKALYGGDANWGSMLSNAVVVSVARAATVTGIRAAPAADGSSRMSLTANVAVTLPGAGVPSGKARFLNALTGDVLADATLAGGTATASLPAGTDPLTIVAAYSGDGCFLGSSSAPVLHFAVVNAASYENTALSPDEIATVFSPALAGGMVAAEQLPLPDTLGGVTLAVIDSAGAIRQAALLYVSPTQLSFLVPAETALGPATLRIETSAGTELTAAMSIAQASPGLFAANANGQGVAAAQIVRVHADGTQEPPQNVATGDAGSGTWAAAPIDPGSPDDNLYLILYGTGIRGESATAAVTINGQTLPTLYAGAQPTYAGLDQVNVLLPKSLNGAGTVNVTVTVGGRPSNTVTLYFR